MTIGFHRSMQRTSDIRRLLKAQGASLGRIATKTGIPKTSLHRYLADAEPAPPADSP
jgi:DNA-binding IclR family transcriptional regulator